MAVALRDDVHDHHPATDLLGAVLAVAVAVLLIVATVAACGHVLMRWFLTLGG